MILTYFNLDMIISIGYRVNSKRATQFRIWATKTLKEHLIKGYTINEKRLLQTQNQLQELHETISFLHDKSKNELLAGQEQEILNLLTNYSKTFTLLEQYDKENLSLIKKAKSRFVLKYDEASNEIGKVKKELIEKKEASDLFGKEVGDKFKAILGNIYQTFSGDDYIHHWKKKPRIFCILSSKTIPLWTAIRELPRFCLFIFWIKIIFFIVRQEKRKLMIMH
jgi:sulfur relay (sulfurtransferase) DsrF/TusC family protein